MLQRCAEYRMVIPVTPEISRQARRMERRSLPLFIPSRPLAISKSTAQAWQLNQSSGGRVQDPPIEPHMSVSRRLLSRRRLAVTRLAFQQLVHRSSTPPLKDQL